MSSLSLDLRDSQITAGFFSFLAHNARTQNICEVQLNDRFGVTDVGISSFLQSPHSDNLRTLRVTATKNTLLNESVRLISHKNKLQKLSLRKSAQENDHSSEIDVSFLSLCELESFGVKVDLKSIVNRNLRVLRIDQMVVVEDLKMLAHLQLWELRIKLHEHQKKSIIDSFTDLDLLSSFAPFNSKLQAVKAFAEGESRRTLRVLDVGRSNCKFKTLFPLFEMPELQGLSLSGCRGLGSEFMPISSKVTNISLSYTLLGVEETTLILENSQRLLSLNIAHTEIKREQIAELMKKTKMFVKSLTVCELQYSHKLLELSKCYDRIESVEMLSERIVEAEQEFNFNCVLLKVAEARKLLRLKISDSDSAQNAQKEMQNKKRILVEKIRNFVLSTGIAATALSNLLVNSDKVTDLIENTTNTQIENSVNSLSANELSVSTNEWKLVSLPKVQFRKNNEIPIVFSALEMETIDQFVHRFIRFQSHNERTMCVELSNNKLIGAAVMEALLKHSKSLVRSVNFRNCVFTFDEIVDTLCQFDELKQINDGELCFRFDGQTLRDKMPKFVKLISQCENVRRLTVQCNETEETENVFAFLSHTLSKCSDTLRSLTIILSEMHIDIHSVPFFHTLFSINELTELEFVLQNCTISGVDLAALWQNGVSRLHKLKRIRLSLPSLSFPALCLENLTDAHLDFCDERAEESVSNKCVRSLASSRSLRTLQVSFANCARITNVLRVFSLLPIGCALEKMEALEFLSLNFEQ